MGSVSFNLFFFFGVPDTVVFGVRRRVLNILHGTCLTEREWLWATKKKRKMEIQYSNTPECWTVFLVKLNFYQASARGARRKFANAVCSCRIQHRSGFDYSGVTAAPQTTGAVTADASQTLTPCYSRHQGFRLLIWTLSLEEGETRRPAHLTSSPLVRSSPDQSFQTWSDFTIWFLAADLAGIHVVIVLH